MAGSDGDYRSLVTGIVENIRNSKDKLDAMSKFYSSLKMTKLFVDHKRILEDTLSEIVTKKYLIPKPEKFAARLFVKEMPEFLDVLLSYVQRKRIDIWLKENKEFHSSIGDVLNRCMFFGKTKNAKIILKYMDASSHDLKTYFEATMLEIHQNMSNLNIEILLKNAAEVIVGKGRNFFLFQVVHAFIEQNEHTKQDWIVALRSIWRSIPDAYLTCDEWTLTFKHVRDYEFVCSVVEFYMSKVCDERGAFWTLQPRSLAHLSRISVRKTLCDNNRLPSGIKSLHLPKELESYLRLEY